MSITALGVARTSFTVNCNALLFIIGAFALPWKPLVILKVAGVGATTAHPCQSWAINLFKAPLIVVEAYESSTSAVPAEMGPPATSKTSPIPSLNVLPNDFSHT